MAPKAKDSKALETTNFRTCCGRRAGRLRRQPRPPRSARWENSSTTFNDKTIIIQYRVLAGPSCYCQGREKCSVELTELPRLWHNLESDATGS